MKALIAASAVALLALVGCGSSNARTYSIAYDGSASQNLPPSCFVNNTVPTQKVELTNERREIVFVIWDGTEGKQYLDISDKTWGGGTQKELGDADPVIIDGLIESTDGKVFSGTRTARTLPNPAAPNPNFSDTQVSTVTVTFDEIGNTAKGSIALKSDYTCTSCQNNGGKVNCSVQYPFSGRRVDYQNFAQVPNQF